MFGNKRLAKRSIIGTRVSALRPQDGRFYPGIITMQISEESITSGAVYYVKFDDGSSTQVKSRSIVGPGFQPVTTANLKRGQKVFLTLNGREVCGTVQRHDRDNDNIEITVVTPSGDSLDTVRRLEEVRLLESRKSARLVDQPDTDYSKLADLQLNSNVPTIETNKKRIPSHVIDVPAASYDKNDRYRRQRHASEEMLDSEQGGDFDDVEMMDETIAALVLTSLSVSPKSPTMTSGKFSQTSSKDTLDCHNPYPDSHLSSSVASSGFYSGHSERDDHSPPLPPLSESAPAMMGYKHAAPASDDDSSNSSGRLFICEEEESTSILYKCTWRGCKVSTTTCDAIERHIRRDHYNRDSDLELTDNEEEFHYTEVDVATQSINTMTKSFAAMNTSSSLDERRHKHRRRHISEERQPARETNSSGGTDSDNGSKGFSQSLGTGGGVFDHDYQRKNSKQAQASSVPTTGGSILIPQGQTTSLPITITEGQIQKSLSWQIHSSSPGALVSPPQRPSKPTPQERLYQHQAQSPKSNIAPSAFKVTQHRRPRSEVRKCRKVYGMEHRDQWCTQCKWKKACTRFID